MLGKLIGLMILAAGGSLMYQGYLSGASIEDQMLQLTKGNLPKETIQYYGGGLACLVIGFLVTFSSKAD